MKNFVFCIIVMCLMFTSCSEQQTARYWGQETTIVLDSGMKLENVVRKEKSFWILQHHRRPNESIDNCTLIRDCYVLSFKENSAFGVIEGKVIIRERQ